MIAAKNLTEQDDDGYFGERVAARYDESEEISGLFDPSSVNPVEPFTSDSRKHVSVWEKPAA